jgi:geranylgeranyl diphosphate synthase, type I
MGQFYTRIETMARGLLRRPPLDAASRRVLVFCRTEEEGMPKDGRGEVAALAYLAARRDGIAASLHDLATRRGDALERAPGEGRAALERVVEYCLRGKMIRGGLVHLGYEAASGLGADRRPRSAAAAVDSAAMAMELFQAGLLVHDDIMDRDETRRGGPSIHALYADEAREAGSTDGPHVGEALGICAGDLCYFEAFAELARASSDHPFSRAIIALCAEVLSEVAAAQMADVSWGASSTEVGEDEILAMYRCKTARYSFSLPLAVGALLAGDEAAASALATIGESLGVAFQLRDDELNLYGDPARTGKRPGGDLREGKKTLLRAGLLAAASPTERLKLESVFGDARASDADIDYVRRLAESLGVRPALSRKAAELADRARSGIAALGRPDAAAREILEGLADYVTLRDK